jgi:hypothetical protein
MQVNAEYIAYNIKVLAQKSSTKKVFLVGHSQGNINIQWALDFWPSMRQYVSGFSSIAGDFHGELLLGNIPPNESEPLSDLQADILQVPPKDPFCAQDRISFNRDASRL